ncbi:MAG: hypothetical protein O2995_15495 [Proteobacteria bacterium]|nr:hypothetical protein [Pseudomonadota bacterium]
MTLLSKAKFVSVVLVAMTWLGASQPSLAMQRVTPPLQLMSDAESEIWPKVDDGSHRSFVMDQMDWLRRGRVAENVLLVTVGAAAVAGVAIGGLAFAIAAGAAGVYIVLALP